MSLVCLSRTPLLPILLSLQLCDGEGGLAALGMSFFNVRCVV